MEFCALNSRTDVMFGIAGRASMTLSHRTSNNIEQFARDGLLTALVVLQLEQTEEFVGIVGRGLHCHHSGSMFGSIAIEKGGVNHQIDIAGDEFREYCFHVGFNNEVIIDTNDFGL